MRGKGGSCQAAPERLQKIIGERSEPPSDKLGGEICIATRALVCIYLSIYICVRPDDRTVPTLYVACAARAINKYHPSLAF